MQRDQKTQLLLLKLPEQKQFTEQAPLHTTPPKGKPPSHLSSSTLQHIPIPTSYKDKLVPTLGSELPREPVVCYHSPLLQQGRQYSLAWISSLASDQFLLIKEVKNLINNFLTPWHVLDF